MKQRKTSNHISAFSICFVVLLSFTGRGDIPFHTNYKHTYITVQCLHHHSQARATQNYGSQPLCWTHAKKTWRKDRSYFRCVALRSGVWCPPLPCMPLDGSHQRHQQRKAGIAIHQLHTLCDNVELSFDKRGPNFSRCNACGHTNHGHGHSPFRHRDTAPTDNWWSIEAASVKSRTYCCSWVFFMGIFFWNKHSFF